MRRLSRTGSPRRGGRPGRFGLPGWLRRDEGSAAIEVVIVAPAVFALLALAITGMRIEVAAQAVDSAAHDAARAASIQRTKTEARTAGTTAARNTLAEEHLICRTLSIVVSADEFDRPLGQPAQVTARITCVVDLSDVAIPGLPGSHTLTSTFTSPLDQYGGR